MFTPQVAKEVVLLKMHSFIQAHYFPIERLTYTAFAQSGAGEALLKRCGFVVAVPASENEQRSPLYVLRPAEASTALDRFDRADECFSRRSTLLQLDSRLRQVEFSLRAIIVSMLNGDPRQLPADVIDNVNKRMLQTAKKDVVRNADYYKTLNGKLEFSDLRELEQTITNKLLWPKFEARFGGKDVLIGKFAQLANLRNPIRHCRPVDEIVRMEGEAAIIWFERVLQKQMGPTRTRKFACGAFYGIYQFLAANPLKCLE